MSDLTTLVDTYLSAWNESDLAVRATLIEAAWDTGGQLVDPPVSGQGYTGISDIASALQGQFPGHQFRRASAIDAHHDALRFTWELVAPDGSVALTGLDVGEVGADGRLTRITGFFGGTPPDRAA
jgi:hypothetical protein